VRLRSNEVGLLGRVREHFDWTLFITVAALAVVGVINLYSATSVARGGHAEVGSGMMGGMIAPAYGPDVS